MAKLIENRASFGVLFLLHHVDGKFKDISPEIQGNGVVEE
jgi:hypothetical protein